MGSNQQRSNGTRMQVHQVICQLSVIGEHGTLLLKNVVVSLTSLICLSWQLKIKYLLKKAREVATGKAEDIKTGLVTYKFGCLTTQTQRWGDTFTNIGLSCQRSWVDPLQVRSLFTTKMELRMITE